MEFERGKNGWWTGLVWMKKQEDPDHYPIQWGVNVVIYYNQPHDVFLQRWISDKGKDTFRPKNWFAIHNDFK